MASKGPRSKLDHDTRARRQKALEAPREPRRPKAHWDHVLEEMVWLSKDFESERKWKLSQAKKVALKASKGLLDHAIRGEKKLKEEEHRLRKVALNISKDVKKFWIKIEKLVLYKHQMELDERKKKALDKQLEFLLGQTERYSTMLAENLVDPHKSEQPSAMPEQLSIEYRSADENNDKKNSGLMAEHQSDVADMDEDYDVHSEDESVDDEHTIEEDEALITEQERKEELEALKNETDIPLEELLKRYSIGEASRECSPEMIENDVQLNLVQEVNDKGSDDVLCSDANMDISGSHVRRCKESNGDLNILENHLSGNETSQLRNSSNISAISTQKHAVYDFNDEQEDGDFVLITGEDKDDETTLSEEEELAKADSEKHIDEIALLQKESEMPVEELLARYKKDFINAEMSEDESDYTSALSEDFSDSPSSKDTEQNCHGHTGASQLILHPDTKQHEMRKDITAEERENEHGVDITAEEKESEHGGNMREEKESEQQVDSKAEEKESEHIIADAAAAARSAQPTGITFSTTYVRTKFPFLLKYPLREYQHIGLDWLVTMYEKRLNGILADEMGLGKTIMTIALLAHLACEKGIWGPHLIVVPTSVMLNWETEFLKWCPAFKILTYFGSAKERKHKRQGWLKPNFFHVCITTYRLVIQDSKVFKRKKWKYLILDEAHLIKNWKSQRWQTLLNFNSKRRILLTGTPLQNDLMELWSLMHFLMPHIFQSHQEFKDWFCNPISGMVEGQERVNKEVIDRLHNVLRPFILRRLKRDVEKQLPMKHEHVIYCRLSKRQRNLYEDFIASSETQATLASANFFGMISVIMQLRKVCNHPDLFEGRPIISSFDMCGIDIQLSSSVCSIFSHGPFSTVNLKDLGLVFTHLDFNMTSWERDQVMAIATPPNMIRERADIFHLEEIGSISEHHNKLIGTNIFKDIQKAILEERLKEAKDWASSIAWWNSLRCQKKPVYSTTLREIVTVRHPVCDIHRQKTGRFSYDYSSKLADIVLSPVERFHKMIDLVESFMFAIPAARVSAPTCWCSRSYSSVFLQPTYVQKCSEVLLPLLSPFRPAVVRRQVYFPDRRLIQFDCGKLQELAILLRRLKSEGHRALIFTQMTKMLDTLEAFINIYGYTYMRLDGSTQPEERQTLMQRFNTNPKIFLFILSTRSGGVGINLVGADTVIFYDSDWNPAMDQQAQDRCHRIGQTREVHIYRLISESTIEENILKKANQKRALDDLVIQSGGYNTEFFKKLDPMELFSDHRTLSIKNGQKGKLNSGAEVSLSTADVEAALKHAEDEADYMALKKVEQEEAVDNQEFTEEAIGKLDDDELINEDNSKVDDLADEDKMKADELMIEDSIRAVEFVDQGGQLTTLSKDNEMLITGGDPNRERALSFAGKEDDSDMLADVKQMTAAGQGILSFENQLRPIDRYAIRLLELWDPIIDKAAVESEIRFEETEWELDRIEKYKEEMEAEIDDDEEPLVYERWDSDFATEAYRQQVEALAQHQLMEALEAEAREKEEINNGYNDSIKLKRASDKSKAKKKPKKAKFKSLKKGALTCELKSVKEETTAEAMYVDDDIDEEETTCSDSMSPSSTVQKKRKKPDDSEEKSSKKSKKLKRKLSERCTYEINGNLFRKRHDDSIELRPCEGTTIDLEQKPTSRSKSGGKFSIAVMPGKRVLVIKPEKLKKGNVWSRDCVPQPDFWLPQEDAILCAVVHEYGPNWSLASETLYGMTAGGFYRGRYRHRIHCCERFRELIQKYVLTVSENSVNEKINNVGSGKSLLKVTEDNVRMLLNVVSEQADNELLLQKHFTALLSAVWRMKARNEHRRDKFSNRNGFYIGGRLFGSSSNQIQNSSKEREQRLKFSNLSQTSKLLSGALHDMNNRQHDERVSPSGLREDSLVTSERLDLTLQLQGESSDPMLPFPPVIHLSVYGSHPSPCVNDAIGEETLKDLHYVAENRFRDAAKTCHGDSSLGWATSAFPANDAKVRSASKSHSLGKHKQSLSDSIKPPKAKLKKIVTEHNETRPLFSELEFQPTRTVGSKDPNLRFDLMPEIIQESWLRDVNNEFTYSIDDEVLPELGSLEMVPHNYSFEAMSGLEDCSILSEYTDIG